MKNRYFITTDILIDYVLENKYSQRDTNRVKLSCEFIKNILKDKKNICVVNSLSLINILFSNQNPNISKLLVNFYNDPDKWQVVEEDENIIKETLKYCEKTNMNYQHILQYLCALKSDCQTIVTSDENFPILDIPILVI